MVVQRSFMRDIRFETEFLSQKYLTFRCAGSEKNLDKNVLYCHIINFRMKILNTNSLWYLEFMIQIKSGLWSFMHIGVVIVNDFHQFGNSWQKNLTVSEIHFSNMG